MRSPGPAAWERTLAGVILGLAGAWMAVLAGERLWLEARDRTVELAFPEPRLLAEAAKNPDAVGELRRAGVSVLVRIPHTLGEMVRYGLAEAWHPRNDQLEIRLADKELASRAAFFLGGQLGLENLQIRFREDQYILDVRLPGAVASMDPGRFILDIPSGAMPDGFERALWLPAGDWGAGKDLDYLTPSLYSLRPQWVIPEWRGGMGAASFYQAYLRTPWLRRPKLGVLRGALPRAGKEALRWGEPRAWIKAVALAPAAFAGISDSGIRRQWVRGLGRDRIRWVFLDAPKSWPWSGILEQVRSLRSELARQGFAAGPSRAGLRTRIGKVALAAGFAGVGAVFFFWIWSMGQRVAETAGLLPAAGENSALTFRFTPAQFRWAVVFLIAGLLILQGDGSAAWAGKAAAWILALLVPGLAASLIPEASSPEAGRLARAGLDWGRVTACSAGAGLAAGVMLYRPEFVAGLDAFPGMRTAQVLGWASAAAVLCPFFLDRAWWRKRWEKPKRVETLAGSLGVCLAAGLGWGLTRGGWPAAAWQSADRFPMQALLGHPCLVLGLAGLRTPGGPEKVWPRICVALGMAGQVSLFFLLADPGSSLASLLWSAGVNGIWGLGLGLAAAGVLGGLRGPRGRRHD